MKFEDQKKVKVTFIGRMNDYIGGDYIGDSIKEIEIFPIDARTTYDGTVWVKPDSIEEYIEPLEEGALYKDADDFLVLWTGNYFEGIGVHGMIEESALRKPLIKMLDGNRNPV